MSKLSENCHKTDSKIDLKSSQIGNYRQNCSEPTSLDVLGRPAPHRKANLATLRNHQDL